MKYLLLLLLSCFLLGCDPYYRIQYSLKNQTTDTVYVKYMNLPDSLTILPPGTITFLALESGIGKAKKVYKKASYQTWFKENSILIKKQSDKTLKKISQFEWKYEKGNAILYLNK